MKRIIVILLLGATATVEASSLRFFGNGVNDIDRVKVEIDDPANSNPGPPADVGATDFTIEFWMRAATGNDAGPVSCGANNDWILGNIMIDRDRFFQDREYGISLAGGSVVFGIMGDGSGARTICGTTDLRDSQWHHVTVQRRRSDGFMWLHVDGTLQRSADGPDGDASYPDNGVPGNFCQPGGNTPCTNSDPFIVFGAEKHDDNLSLFPSYSGWLDEIRYSTELRYGAANFTPPSAPFTADMQTAALYHFDEGSGDMINDSAFGGSSPGVRRFGGNPAGPVWSTETPFSGAPSPGVLALSASNYAVNEGAANLTIPVRRTGGAAGAASVTVTVNDGTATAGADYTVATPVILSWADGDAADKSVLITIVNDSQPESAETFQIALSNATGATLGNPASATATIQDNDAAPQPGTLQFSVANAPVGEAGGSITLTVNRVSGTDGDVSVNYATANGTATAGADYAATNGTLNFADGQASASLQVPITDDAAVEGAETFTVTLSSPAGGASLGAPLTITVTITDNDAVPPPPPPPAGGGGGGAAGWPSLGILFVLAWLGIGRRERLSAA